MAPGKSSVVEGRHLPEGEDVDTGREMIKELKKERASVLFQGYCLNCGRLEIRPKIKIARASSEMSNPIY